jgi:hypothetical protein
MFLQEERPMDVEFGNAGDLFTNDTGWFLGFSEWTKSETAAANLRFMPKERRSHTLSMKWMDHPAGDDRGTAKPPSEGRTLSILVSERGVFRIGFSSTPAFSDERTEKFALTRHGDFVIWGEGLHHRWFVDDRCTILTLRWIPD